MTQRHIIVRLGLSYEKKKKMTGLSPHPTPQRDTSFELAFCFHSEKEKHTDHKVEEIKTIC